MTTNRAGGQDRPFGAVLCDIDRLYEIAADRAGARAERCPVVDDLPENIKAAVRLGMTGALFREAADPRAALGALLAPGLPG
ncbi:hypothetical protein GCM10010387_23480 [Streptomyces inusitatus]|uniref:Uncharacterized protein n=1 Tax=Streptomyces inusitatus TaxID=68221 RepID=A0A918URK9_9ACTN|nr:hypothetical protein [Streptomyces inusitatus]GGZ29409.1 hypothetical protein GCM10010387_23480 [Streptomyces inusitatus]